MPAGLTIAQCLATDLPLVQADELRLKQILLNLLSNAVKFTPPDGRISIGATLVDGGLEIAVADTGIGIASQRPRQGAPPVRPDRQPARAQISGNRTGPAACQIDGRAAWRRGSRSRARLASARGRPFGCRSSACSTHLRRRSASPPAAEARLPNSPRTVGSRRRRLARRRRSGESRAGGKGRFHRHAARTGAGARID